MFDADPDSPMEIQLTGSIRCPTCRAEQEWSEECRRCKSSLVLLHDAHLASYITRRDCLKELQDGSPATAVELARKHIEIAGNAEAYKLLAVCLLHAGEWYEAMRIAQRFEEE